MKDNVSPEERLLHIIKGVAKKGKSLEPALPHPEANSLQAIKKENACSKAKTAGYEIKNVPYRDIARKIFILKRINRGFFVTWCLLVIAILLMGRNLKHSTIALNAEEEFLKNEQAQSEEKSKAKPFSYYSDIIAKKGLFRISVEEAKKEVRNNAIQIAPLDLLSNYSLAGVVSGERPQAIIEDKKSQKTYFLYKGQSLGDFKINDIIEGKVVLELNGEKFELSL